MPIAENESRKKIGMITKIPISELTLLYGSGTTLIAAEMLNRRCYAIEISPEYVDVIIKRYCNYTKTDEEEIYGAA